MLNYWFDALIFNKIFASPEGSLIALGDGFVIIPPNPDVVSAPMDLVNGFRMMSALSVSVLWLVNALILGVLWQKFKPHFSGNKIEIHSS